MINLPDLAVLASGRRRHSEFINYKILGEYDIRYYPLINRSHLFKRQTSLKRRVDRLSTEENTYQNNIHVSCFYCD